MATSFFFYYLPLLYGILFFTKHISPSEADFKGAPGNYNETHAAAVVLGLTLGMLMRRRLRR
jgi:hypothetical protein